MTAALATLNPAAQVALVSCEQRIERGLKSFLDVGQALTEIRDSRLYKGTHDTFEDYCRERWNLSRPRAYEMIGAAEVVSGMPDTAAPITSARQATELAKVPELERAEVWQETVERTNGKPTAAAVREVTEEQRKRAAEQRDAREHLRQIVELAWSPNWPEGHVEHWAKQLGPYDHELSDLVERATRAISVLDGLIEGSGR